jgi:chemotaxis protein histidine kinase CheA
MMMDVDQELLEAFATEAAEHLEALEQSPLPMETSGADDTLVQAGVHALKGDAACVGHTALASSAHIVEGLLDKFWAHELSATSIMPSVWATRTRT